jgi:hypothetical protein
VYKQRIEKTINCLAIVFSKCANQFLNADVGTAAKAQQSTVFEYHADVQPLEPARLLWHDIDPFRTDTAAQARDFDARLSRQQPNSASAVRKWGLSRNWTRRQYQFR